MRYGVVIVVLNLPVPDDQRVWAEALAVAESGVRVRVICPALRGHRAGRAVVDKVAIARFPAAEGAGVFGTVLEATWNTIAASALSIYWLAADGVLQVCNPPDTLWPLMRIARLRGAGIVYDQHDVASEMALARPTFRFLAPLMKWLEARTVAAAHVIVTSSEEQRRRLSEIYGVPSTLVRSAGAIAAERHGSSPIPVIGYLGVIGEQDGVDDLIRAVAELQTRGRHVTLTIAGDGPYLAHLQSLAAELGVADVDFLGWLGPDGVTSFLGSIDVMVAPDKDTTYGHYCAMNKVTHAMANAIPVVLRPLRENLRLTGYNAFVASDFSVVALADALDRFLDSSEAKRASVGAALQARYRANHDWSQQRTAYLGALRRAARCS